MTTEAQIAIAGSIQAGNTSLAKAMVAINEASFESNDTTDDRRTEVLQHLSCAQQFFESAFDQMKIHNKSE